MSSGYRLIPPTDHVASVSFYPYGLAFATVYPDQAIVVLYIAGVIYSLPLEHW